MSSIISEILEMCSYDKDYVRQVADELFNLCDRTNDYFEEE